MLTVPKFRKSNPMWWQSNQIDQKFSLVQFWYWWSWTHVLRYHTYGTKPCSKTEPHTSWNVIINVITMPTLVAVDKFTITSYLAGNSTWTRNHTHPTPVTHHVTPAFIM